MCSKIQSVAYREDNGWRAATGSAFGSQSEIYADEKLGLDQTKSKQLKGKNSCTWPLTYEGESLTPEPAVSLLSNLGRRLLPHWCVGQHRAQLWHRLFLFFTITVSRFSFLCHWNLLFRDIFIVKQHWTIFEDIRMLSHERNCCCVNPIRRKRYSDVLEFSSRSNKS